MTRGITLAASQDSTERNHDHGQRVRGQQMDRKELAANATAGHRALTMAGLCERGVSCLDSVGSGP